MNFWQSYFWYLVLYDNLTLILNSYHTYLFFLLNTRMLYKIFIINNFIICDILF